MMEGKENTVNKLTKGIDYLFKKNNIKYISGKASIESDQIARGAIK